MQTNELTTVRLYGPLGALFGRVHKLAVTTPKETVRALSVVIPGFERYMMTAKQRGLTFAVFKGKRNISAGELDDNHGHLDIRIAPIIIGSKRGGLFQTLLGVTLIAVGVMTSWTGVGASIGMVGVSMALGGVIQMLSPQVGGMGSRQDPDNKPSYAFGGPVNSTAQGNPVPLLFGCRRIGGAVISAGIYAEDQQ